MSLKTVGYTPEGAAIRVDEGPSSVSSTSWLRGTTQYGEPGPVEAERKAAAKARNETTPEQRAAAYQRTKRYRERQRDAA